MQLMFHTFLFLFYVLFRNTYAFIYAVKIYDISVLIYKRDLNILNLIIRERRKRICFLKKRSFYLYFPSHKPCFKTANYLYVIQYNRFLLYTRLLKFLYRRCFPFFSSLVSIFSRVWINLNNLNYVKRKKKIAKLFYSYIHFSPNAKILKLL